MNSGKIGALVGFVIGLMAGTALFGPLGAVIGGFLGAVAGFGIVTPLAVGFAKDAARRPISVECPETHREVQVTLDPEAAGRAELWNRRQRIETCTRFDGPPNCDQACVDQLEF